MRYRLDLPDGWRRLKDKEGGEADIYAERNDRLAWLIVRSTSGTSIRLDDLVAYRRDLVFRSNQVSGYQETRSYHRGEADVPVSIARYVLGPAVILVMTAVDGTLAVECMGGTGLTAGREGELLALFESLRFVEQVSP